jgi:RimJ/RimL family protein N-acetyltransferase
MNLSDYTITIRPFELSDAEKHLAGEDDDQIKWLSGGKSTLEGVRNWISKNQKYWEIDGSIFNFAIVVEDKLVGMVEANTDSESLEGVDDGDANISYGLYPSARGKGYTTKAINLLIGFLKDRDIKRAVIRVDLKT